MAVQGRVTVGEVEMDANNIKKTITGDIKQRENVDMIEADTILSQGTIAQEKVSEKDKIENTKNRGS